MSVPVSPSKRFLLAQDGALINVDYVVRVYVDGMAVKADLQNGPSITLRGSTAQITDLQKLLAINGVA